MKLPEDQLTEWRELKARYESDDAWAADFEKLRARRLPIQEQIVDFLRSFLAGRMGIEELRSTWDTKTRKGWNSFGLKGTSSAMFLNMLVKHVPDQAGVSAQLVRVIPTPADEADARQRMGGFHRFLEAEIEAGRVARRRMQTARVPFFLSAFWHLQEPERWPMFFLSARQVFQRRGLFGRSSNVVDDYFRYREVYLSLMAELGLDSWGLEQLCWFETESGKTVVTVDPDDGDKDDDAEEDEDEDGEQGDDEGGKKDEADVASAHTCAQWLLASIGKSLGCRVWIASNDHAKTWNGVRLGDLSISALPHLGVGNEAAEKIVRLIDVLWIKSANQVVASFEIEHSTSVYSGLLRMADLTVLSPNLAFPLYVVAPERRLPKVRRELARPSLQALELHERCGLFSIEALVREAEHMQRWAKDPAAIDNLAEYVKAVATDDAE